MGKRQRYYEVRYKGHTFHAIVEKRDYKYVYFGGIDECLQFTVYPDIDPDFEIANMIALRTRNKKCSLEDEYTNGDASIATVEAGMMFVYTLFDHVKGFSLVDKSKIACKNGLDVSLAEYSYIRYGFTWYERHFGARPETPTLRKKMKHGWAKLLQTKMPDFETFYKRWVRLPTQKNAMMKVFRQGMTYAEYFGALHAKHDCSMFTGWLHLFVTNLLGTDISYTFWIIDRKDIGEVDVNIMKDKPPLFIAMGGDDILHSHHGYMS